jgi:hypothetical protein
MLKEQEPVDQGVFLAEEVDEAGDKWSVQITQDKIMKSLSILDVINTKPSGLGTIFFNCQSMPKYQNSWSRCFYNLYVHLHFNPKPIPHLYMK